MMINEGLLTAAYIVASVLFILSLSGLSNQETARRGNIFGIIGMLIAIFATIWGSQVTSYAVLAVTMSIGAVIGTIVAIRVQMTGMPQLVAMLHSFVGLAAVLVGFNSYFEMDHNALIVTDEQQMAVNIHLVEVFLGVFIVFSNKGVTFSKG